MFLRPSNVLTWMMFLALSATAGEVSFTKPPVATAKGAGCEVAFAVSQPCDVTVAILNAKDQIVRHLAAGVLGPKAPAPFKQDTLEQTLAWDGKDDLGQPAQGGPFAARVSAGVRPQFDRIAGYDARSFSPIAAVTVSPAGEVYVLFSDSFWGRSELKVFGRDGKYLRTIVPYPADTPKERSASVGHILTPDGRRLPMVFNGHCHTLHPLMAGMKTQTMAWHPKGHLVMASAVGTMAEHGPPRHLLAVDARGGAPEGISFVGPEFLKPRGFMGGAAEGPSRWFEHLAVSPDGEWIYFVTSKLQRKDEDPRRIVPLRHAVFRVKWTDADLGKPFLGEDGKAGSDDAHLSDPQGLATDAKGNLYVCDRGNARVMVFDPAGKLLGKFAAQDPEQIHVHPKGEIYLFCRKEGKDVKAATLLKLAPFQAGEAPKELAKLVLDDVFTVALDPSAEPRKLWAASYKKCLHPIADHGERFELGAQINDNESGCEHPMFLAPDPDRERIIVREKPAGLYQIDLKSGAYTPLGIKGYDAKLDRDGNIYVMDGYGKNSLSRYTPEGKPLPFAATGSNKLKITYRGYGPNIGLRGHCVGLDGSLYVICSTNYGGAETIGSRVHCFAPDGSMKKEALINGLGYGDCGVGVDAQGNVYVGANVKPKGSPFPPEFAGQASEQRWVFWRKGTAREKPWHYTYYNTYLFHVGSVFKFGPQGGAFYGQDIAQREEKRTQDVIDAAKAPEGSAEYTSAYLGREVRVAGAQWHFQGASNVPSSSDGPSPDPGCVCYNSHLSADPWGRVYAAHTFGFTVNMLDPGGNLIARIGAYGNADSAGPKSAVPEPEIALACPNDVGYADGKLYIADSVNRRVMVVRLDYQAEAKAGIR